jgi:hypothetical protein
MTRVITTTFMLQTSWCLTHAATLPLHPGEAPSTKQTDQSMTAPPALQAAALLLCTTPVHTPSDGAGPNHET